MVTSIRSKKKGGTYIPPPSHFPTHIKYFPPAPPSLVNSVQMLKRKSIVPSKQKTKKPRVAKLNC